jgi:hypothetical protein
MGRTPCGSAGRQQSAPRARCGSGLSRAHLGVLPTVMNELQGIPIAARLTKIREIPGRGRPDSFRPLGELPEGHHWTCPPVPYAPETRGRASESFPVEGELDSSRLLLRLGRMTRASFARSTTSSVLFKPTTHKITRCYSVLWPRGHNFQRPECIRDPGQPSTFTLPPRYPGPGSPAAHDRCPRCDARLSAT